MAHRPTITFKDRVVSPRRSSETPVYVKSWEAYSGTPANRGFFLDPDGNGIVIISQKVPPSASGQPVAEPLARLVPWANIADVDYPVMTQEEFVSCGIIDWGEDAEDGE